MRKPISKQLRKDVIKQFGINCYLCGRKTTTQNRHLDHINPVVNGGENTIDNLRVACKQCNTRKSDIDILIYIERELSKLNLHLDTLLALKKSLQST